MTEYEKPVLVSTEDACTPVISLGLMATYLLQNNYGSLIWRVTSDMQKGERLLALPVRNYRFLLAIWSKGEFSLHPQVCRPD